jgi:flagellin-like protein
MRRYKEWSRRKKGVAGIIAAIILFAMIFTTGTAYFIFVYQSYQLQQKAAIERNQMEIEQSLEQFEVGGKEISGSELKLQAIVNNTGPIPITVVYVFIIDPTTGTVQTEDLTSNPKTVNPGETNIPVGTGVTYATGSPPRLIKVVTERGKTGSGMHPPQKFPGITESELAQGFGMVRLIFLSFRYYTYDSKNPFKLLNFPTGTNAFNSPTGTEIAFGVEIKNLDPDKRTFTLDSHTMLWQFNPKQGNQYYWYVVNVNATGYIQTTYTPISIAYNETKLIIFASGKDGDFSGPKPPQVSVSNWSGLPSAVFILLHGTLGTTPYGQNMPYTSVYWY